VKRTGAESELARLEPLVGEWGIGGPDADAPSAGRMTCEWFGDRAFLVMRTAVDVPGAPEALMVVGPGDAPGTFRQRYFDSRGVERDYSMTIDEAEWRIERRWRESPSGFDQRFIGRFADGGDTIEARWERADNGADWELDFELVYRRVR
jgi:hypothetical protein